MRKIFCFLIALVLAVAVIFPFTAYADEGIGRVDYNDAPYGDVNYDGDIDNCDLVLLARYLVGAEELDAEQLEKADVNFDLSVDNIDLVMLARYMAGYTF